MANKFDGDVILNTNRGSFVFQDPASGSDKLKLQYSATDPNGVLQGPLGSIASGAAGIFINVDGGTTWLPASATNSAIVWGPTGTVQTWAEVMQFVSANAGPTTIYVDTQGIPLDIPAGVYELKGSTLNATQFGDPITNVIRILDGAVLRNLDHTFGAMILQGNSSSPCLEYDAPPMSPTVAFIDFNSVWQNNGTAPMILVNGSFQVISLRIGGFYAGTAPIVELVGPSILVVRIIEGTQAFDPFLLDNPASLTVYLHDGTLSYPIPFPTIPLGTLINNPAGIVGGSGPSLYRPVPFAYPIVTGCMYFDTDLVPPRPIYWNDSAGFWVDALGVGPV